jgi:RNA polymerase sigma-70 factor (sigma-E family)
MSGLSRPFPPEVERTTIKAVFERAASLPAEKVEPAELEFAAFFDQEFGGVARTAFLIVHDADRARDVAQDAFVELFSRWDRISRYDRPDAWVRRVAIRRAVRVARREHMRPRLERQVEPATVPIPIDLDVVRAVRELPASQRAAVVLFYFEDRPVSEVADILNCSVTTAKVHLHRARKRLAQLLGEPETVEADDGT